MSVKQTLNFERRFVREKPYYPPNQFSYGNDEPWCADFQRYCLEHTGLKDWVRDFPNRFAYCPSIWTYAGRHGYRKYSGKPGDLVLFDWNGDKVSDHIGMVLKAGRGGYWTVEGNTSSASWSNGNCVQVRFRETRYIRGFVRPPYKPYKRPEPKKGGFKGSKINLLKHRDGNYLGFGDYGSKNVKKLQKFLNWYADAGLAEDGDYGKMTKEAVYAFQKANGLTIDGVVGRQTLAKIELFYK